MLENILTIIADIHVVHITFWWSHIDKEYTELIKKR